MGQGIGAREGEQHEAEGERALQLIGHQVPAEREPEEPGARDADDGARHRPRGAHGPASQAARSPWRWLSLAHVFGGAVCGKHGSDPQARDLCREKGGSF